MKTLPNSSQAEETVIASILLDGIETMQIALDKKVCEDSFYDERNKLLWKTFLWAFKRGTPLETDAITAALTEKGKLAQVGGIEHLLNVTLKTPTTSGTRHAIDKLQELLMLREIIKRSQGFIEAAHDYTGDMAQLTTSIEECLKIRDGLEKTATLSDSCDAAETRLKRVLSGEPLKDGENGLLWPWADANKWLHPIQAGELVILAARPGRGKSSIARQLAWHWSSHFGDVLMFSREMTINEMAPLFAQTLCGHSFRDARNGSLHKRDTQELIHSLSDVKANKRLFIFDKDRTATQIVARIKAHVLKAGKPAAVIIDYLQAYDPEQGKETLDTALGRMTRAFKDLAIDICPVVLLAQFNRSAEKEERPARASDLRSSGSIEQDGDRVLSCDWLPEFNGTRQDFNDQSTESIHCSLTQLKGRSAGCGTIGLRFHRPSASFHSEATE